MDSHVFSFIPDRKNDTFHSLGASNSMKLVLSMRVCGANSKKCSLDGSETTADINRVKHYDDCRRGNDSGKECFE